MHYIDYLQNHDIPLKKYNKKKKNHTITHVKNRKPVFSLHGRSSTLHERSPTVHKLFNTIAFSTITFNAPWSVIFTGIKSILIRCKVSLIWDDLFLCNNVCIHECIELDQTLGTQPVYVTS